MDSNWLRENMLTILSVIGVASTLCVGGIIVLYFMIKKNTRDKAKAKAKASQ